MSEPQLRARVQRELHGIVERMSKEASLKASMALQEKLYFAASQEGKYMKALFPDTREAFLPKTWEDTTITPGTKLYLVQKKEALSHKGRNCARKFGVGEPIYRCLDCGFDETCVLCVHCFNKKDHQGHQVMASVASEVNTGICDCGDPEAWISELHCKCDVKTASSTEGDSNTIFDERYQQYLRDLFDLCLEYVIEVFAHQNQTVPPVQKKLSDLATADLNDDLMDLLEMDIERRESAMADFSGLASIEGSDRFALLFWNDEYHNFQEAQSAIRNAGKTTQDYAKELSNLIDQNGRAVLTRKSTLRELLPNLRQSSKQGFDATIMTLSEFNRQELANYILVWFSKVMNHPVADFQRIARRAFCESICGRYKIPLERRPFWNSEDRHFDAYAGLLRGTDVPSTYLPSDKLERSSLSYETEPTRLKYLLFFEPRFFKVMRSNLHEVLIGTLVSDLEYKATACDQIISIYGSLLYNTYKFDREAHRTIMDEISTQFFTCPTNSNNIVRDSLERVILPAKFILQDMCSSLTGKIVLPLRKTDDPTLGKLTVHNRILGDMTTIFEKATDIAPLFTSPNLESFISILGIYDDCYTFTRQIGDHVVNEDLRYKAYESPVARVNQIVAAATSPEKIDGSKTDLFAPAVTSLMENIHGSGLIVTTHKYKDFEIPTFKVSSEPVGFFHPSHTMLSNILRFRAFQNTDAMRVVLEEAGDMQLVADFALRPIVLASQIEARHWIRNGTAILRLAAAYMDRGFSDFESTPFKSDVFLNQVAFLTGDPSGCLINVIDRFELLEWFSGEVHLMCTAYDSKVVTIVEKLLSFLYAVLSERSDFVHFENRREHYRHDMKELVTYLLFLKPKTYSEIQDEVEPDVLSDPVFQEVLTEVSTYTPPRGLNDDGMYSLKKSEYKNVDPLKMAAQDVDFVDSVSVISKHIASQGSSPDSFILTPKLQKLDAQISLGSFTRTQFFAKLICKIFDHATSETDESNVAMALHLLHAAIIDSQMVYGEKFFIDAYVQVPLCEALFKISHVSKFSKSVISKADHLLELLILKDRELVLEALVSCYGHDTVECYKESKKSAGVDFDETESDRKRRLAKERQQKILKKMQRKQKEFIDKNDTESPEEQHVERKQNSQDKTCVLCQGLESKDSMVAIPMTIVESEIFRSYPSADDLLSRVFVPWGDDSIKSTQDNVGKALLPRDSLDLPLTISSCNHGIHFRCLQEHVERNHLRDYSIACPLCQTKNDAYLPSLLKSRDFNHQDLNPQVRESDIDPDGSDHTISDRLLSTAPLYGMHGIGDLDHCIDINLGRSMDDDSIFYSTMKSIRRKLSLSLAQAEIVTRINGASSYTGFLDQIPEQTFRALRSYFDFYLIADMERVPPEAELEMDRKHFLDTKLLIEVFILYFLEGNTGFAELLKQLVFFFSERLLRSVLNRVDGVPLSQLPPAHAIEPSLAALFRKLLQNRNWKMRTSPELLERFSADDEFSSTVIGMTLQTLLVSIRPVAVFYKVLVPSFTLSSTTDDTTLSYIDLILTALTGSPLASILDDLSVNVLFSQSKNTLGKFMPYPGVIKLVDLPQELSYFTTMSETDTQRFPLDKATKNSENRIDFRICLVCGHKLFERHQHQDVHEHLKNSESCKSKAGGLFLTPRRDTVLLVAYKDDFYYHGTINAPYLNVHGQSGPRAAQSGLPAMLSYDRYKYLNSLWLSGGIYSYLTRTSKGPQRINGADTVENLIWRQMLRATNGGVPEGLAGGVENNALLEMIRERFQGAGGLDAATLMNILNNPMMAGMPVGDIDNDGGFDDEFSFSDGEDFSQNEDEEEFFDDDERYDIEAPLNLADLLRGAQDFSDDDDIDEMFSAEEGFDDYDHEDDLDEVDDGLSEGESGLSWSDSEDGDGDVNMAESPGVGTDYAAAHDPVSDFDPLHFGENDVD